MALGMEALGPEVTARERQHQSSHRQTQSQGLEKRWVVRAVEQVELGLVLINKRTCSGVHHIQVAGTGGTERSALGTGGGAGRPTRR